MDEKRRINPQNPSRINRFKKPWRQVTRDAAGKKASAPVIAPSPADSSAAVDTSPETT
jgi:hypothetical protein